MKANILHRICPAYKNAFQIEEKARWLLYRLEAQADYNGSLLSTLQQEVDRHLRLLIQIRGDGIPNLEAEDIKRGLQAWLSLEDGNTQLNITLPFKYRPQYMTREGNWYRIPEDTCSKLSRDIFVLFRLRGKDFSFPLLVWKPMGEPFYHYHFDCWGTVRIQCPTMIPSGLYYLRDRLEAELHSINLDSLVETEPKGLPHLERLFEHASPCQAPSISVPPNPSRLAIAWAVTPGIPENWHT